MKLKWVYSPVIAIVTVGFLVHCGLNPNRLTNEETSEDNGTPSKQRTAKAANSNANASNTSSYNPTSSTPPPITPVTSATTTLSSTVTQTSGVKDLTSSELASILANPQLLSALQTVMPSQQLGDILNQAKAANGGTINPAAASAIQAGLLLLGSQNNSALLGGLDLSKILGTNLSTQITQSTAQATASLQK